VENLEEMTDAALAFSLLPAGEYLGCSVAGGGGALGIAAADAAETFGLAVPRLREDIQKAILDVLPKPGSSPANPIDIANPFVTPAAIKDILLYAAKDENVDIHILIQLLYHYKSIQSSMGNVRLKDITPCRELACACSKAMETGGKPVMLVLPNFKQEEDAMEIEEVIRETRRLFTEAGMPVFDDVKNALRAIAAVSGYYRRRKIIANCSMQ
jgi:acyl-CoA synthetase (NDP forming)